MSAWIYIIIAAGALLLLAGVFFFNRMIRMRNKVRRAWKDIDVQLKLRYNLIPLLVQTAQGYALHEQQALESVTNLRVEAEAAPGIGERGTRELILASALGKVLMLKEYYPDLKADANFERLSQQLVQIEDHLAAARKYYNGSVRIYNTYIQSFPQLLLAHLVAFRPSEYFQLEDEAVSAKASGDNKDK